MLRYTKNGPLRAGACTSAQGAAQAALQRLLRSNTRLQTEPEKATFYEFHGEIKAAREHASRACWSFVNVPAFLLLLQPLLHLWSWCCESSWENVGAGGAKVGVREVPLLLLLILSPVRLEKRQVAVCWCKDKPFGTGDGGGRFEPRVCGAAPGEAARRPPAPHPIAAQPHKTGRVPLFRAGTGFLKYL